MRLPLLAATAVATFACGHPQTRHDEPPPGPADAATVATPDATPAAAAGPPAARTVDTTEELFGVTVHDPYRWMEGSDNAELTDWLRAQGEYTQRYLAQIDDRDRVLARVRELGLGTSVASAAQLAGGKTFYQVIAAGEQLPKLTVRGADGADRVLVDPATRGTGEGHASVNAFAPSPDGKRIAYDLATGGGEVSQLYVMDVATGTDLPDVIDRIWGEFAASWLPDGKGFFYTQMAPPAAGVDPMLNMTVKLHMLGEPVDKDVTMIGAGGTDAFKLAPEEFPFIAATPGSKWVMSVAGGAHAELRVAVAKLSELDRTGAGKTAWRTVAEYADGIESNWIHGDRIYLMQFKDAPNRRIVSVPLAKPVLAKATVELGEPADGTIDGIVVARDALYVRKMGNGQATILRRPWKGKASQLALPYPGAVDELVTDPTRDGVTLGLVGWTRPAAYYAYDVKAKKLAPTGIAVTTDADYSAIVADETEATSADGTKVPISILHRADLALDGTHPGFVYAYGGYGISQNPTFRAERLVWLERGGVYAICHVRGGSEKGYQWQVDGTHEHKLNGVHDFEACGQYLIDQKYTTSSRLFGAAASMGGVLIGRAITDRPELFAAVQIAVGIVNPLRILAAENGANQKTELGDPDTEAGFTSILAMDPYQHVEAGTAYPAVLFTVGLNDKRVAPWMTGKMAARMQLASTSGKPVLVRIEADAGHGVGSTRDQALAERADVYAFFFAIAAAAH